MDSLTDISGALLLQVKKSKPTDSIQKSLSNSSFDSLLNQLNKDEAKKCFWINIYNAYYQLLAASHNESKGNIYHRKEIQIAGNKYSLDEIEHGILRRYRWKFSKGYLPNLFTPKLIKNLAVNTIDYRIHFALNCGAVSCPPIAFYKEASINEQLDLATQSFLETETTIHADSKQVETTRLFQWFAGDFGGKKGTKKILSQVFNQDLHRYSLKFKEYNWDKELANFI